MCVQLPDTHSLASIALFIIITLITLQRKQALIKLHLSIPMIELQDCAKLNSYAVITVVCGELIEMAVIGIHY